MNRLFDTAFQHQQPSQQAGTGVHHTYLKGSVLYLFAHPLENLFQEHQGLALTWIPDLTVDMALWFDAEEDRLDPSLLTLVNNALGTTLDSTQSVNSLGERIVPIRFVMVTALHLGMVERVSDALALAMATVHDTGAYSIELMLDELQDPIDRRAQPLNYADFATTVEIMTATISKMDTVADDNQSVGLVEMLLHLQGVLEPDDSKR